MILATSVLTCGNKKLFDLFDIINKQNFHIRSDSYVFVYMYCFYCLEKIALKPHKFPFKDLDVECYYYYY